MSPLHEMYKMMKIFKLKYACVILKIGRVSAV
jgi:hypothetical protein